MGKTKGEQFRMQKKKERKDRTGPRKGGSGGSVLHRGGKSRGSRGGNDKKKKGSASGDVLHRRKENIIR